MDFRSSRANSFLLELTRSKTFLQRLSMSRVIVEVGWFQFYLQNAANSVIVPLPNVKFLTLRAGEAL